MDTKLTLKLDQSVIKNAKDYARKHEISLSRLIENYLQKITGPAMPREITPLVKELSGIINLPADLDHRSGYADYLKNKYK